jgi:hypothetical protein
MAPVFSPSVFNPGVFNAAAPVVTTFITPNTGVLDFTGQLASVRRATRITPLVGALVLMGQLATAGRSTYISPATGSLVLSGLQPVIVRAAVLALLMNSGRPGISLTMNDALVAIELAMTES